MIDVAKKAGVSPATVSRVLGKKVLVKNETIAKVQQAIEALHYEIERPVKHASKNKLLAVLIPAISDQFFSVLLQGIEDIARMHKYNMIVCNSNNAIQIETENISLLSESGVEGIIIVPCGSNVKAIDTLLAEHRHVVFLDRILERDDINYVISDDEGGAYQAIKYLLHLGHRDILYVGGDKEVSTEKNRLKGFKKAMLEHGLEIKNELIRECSFNSEMIYAETQEIMRLALHFTAVFAASDLIGLSVQKALQEVGKAIPNDISLIGYGDLPFSKFISLTTVSSPAYEMGKNAMILLLDLIQGRAKKPNRVELQPSIIFRSTCKHNMDNLISQENQTSP